MSTHERGLTCELTAFRVDPRVNGGKEWMAIATTHRFNPNPNTGGVLTPEAVVLAGAVMEVVDGRAAASSQEEALVTALKALFFQLGMEWPESAIPRARADR